MSDLSRQIPLDVIKGFGEMLDEMSDDEAADFLNACRKAAEEMEAEE